MKTYYDKDTNPSLIKNKKNNYFEKINSLNNQISRRYFRITFIK